MEVQHYLAIRINEKKLSSWLLTHHFGDEKEDLKVTLLRVESSSQGLFSCLLDLVPDSRNGIVDDQNHIFPIAGATGCTVGTAALLEKATEIVHAACKKFGI